MPREAPWKTLCRELVDEGFESPYLDRLLARVDPEQELEAVEKEIVREMASALGRAEEKVLVALLELERLDRNGAPDAAWLAQRAAAERARRDLIIHREALKLYDAGRVEAAYPIPNERLARRSREG